MFNILTWVRLRKKMEMFSSFLSYHKSTGKVKEKTPSVLARCKPQIAIFDPQHIAGKR